jgi:hypothetical protein
MKVAVSSLILLICCLQLAIDIVVLPFILLLLDALLHSEVVLPWRKKCTRNKPKKSRNTSLRSFFTGGLSSVEKEKQRVQSLQKNVSELLMVFFFFFFFFAGFGQCRAQRRYLCCYEADDKAHRKTDFFRRCQDLSLFHFNSMSAIDASQIR